MEFVFVFVSLTYGANETFRVVMLKWGFREPFGELFQSFTERKAECICPNSRLGKLKLKKVLKNRNFWSFKISACMNLNFGKNSDEVIVAVSSGEEG